MAWRSAQRVNTSKAYRGFINSYPRSCYVPAASAKLGRRRHEEATVVRNVPKAKGTPARAQARPIENAWRLPSAASSPRLRWTFRINPPMHFDIVHAANPRYRGGTSSALRAELKAAKRFGLSSRLAPLHR